MNIAIWIVIALMCFVMPAVALTGGGRKVPGRQALTKYAREVGLPLTDDVARPVIDRIRRRERGAAMGALAAIVLGALASIVIDGSESWGALVIVLAGAGAGFGGAWALAAHRPASTSDRPVVARVRSVALADYLTPAERFALNVAPLTLLVGAAVGTALLRQLPADVRGSGIAIGLIGTVIALMTWGFAVLALHRVLAAPARSGSDLELAWDDAERAFGLRQVNDLVVAVTCIALGFWLALMANALIATDFYREGINTAYVLTAASLALFGMLIVAVLFGPMWAGISGRRKGYEQRRLWPNGVSLP